MEQKYTTSKPSWVPEEKNDKFACSVMSGIEDYLFELLLYHFLLCFHLLFLLLKKIKNLLHLEIFVL